MRSQLYISLLIIIACSCINDTSLQFSTVSSYKTINIFSDSTYFDNIYSIVISENSYYFADYTNSRIVKTNENLDLVTSIGGYGEGPNEFKGLTEMYLYDDRLYAIDDGNVRINVYKYDDWLRSVKLPTYGAILQNFYVDEKDSVIIYSRLGKTTNIISMDLLGNNVITKKINEVSYWDKQRKVKAASHILKTINDNLIVIPLDEPVIFVYNPDWKLVRKLTLDNIPILSKPISMMAAEYHTLAHNTTNILFYDVCIDNNNLYILTRSIVSNQDSEFNILMKLRLFSDSIVYDKSYKLVSENRGAWYNAIAVRNDTLVAFESATSEIQLFSLIEE